MEFVLQQVDVDGFVFLVGVFQELGDINRLTEVNHRSAAVAEVVAVFDGGGDDIDGTLVAELLVGIHGDVEQALAHAQQRVLGAVHAFGEEVEVDMVVDDIDGFVERVVVLAHGSHAVTDAEDGQDAQKSQNLGHDRILEDVAARDEHFFAVVGRQ